MSVPHTVPFSVFFLNLKLIFYIYFVGVGSALMGKEAAMACTVAVETAIGEHYDK